MGKRRAANTSLVLLIGDSRLFLPLQHSLGSELLASSDSCGGCIVLQLCCIRCI
jgi:hypothetical protein